MTLNVYLYYSFKLERAIEIKRFLEKADEVEYLREKCRKISKRSRSNKKKKMKLEDQEIFSKHAILLSQEKLLEFGAELDKEYIILSETGVDCEQWRGYSHQESNEYWGVSFDKTYEDNYDKNEYPFHYYEKPKLEYKKTAGENYKNVYYHCLDKLNEFGFDIFRIDKDPSGFKNRGVSCCCGGTDVFHFYCQKNAWQFIATFADDCDCEPGLFVISKITNKHIIY